MSNFKYYIEHILNRKFFLEIVENIFSHYSYDLIVILVSIPITDYARYTFYLLAVKYFADIKADNVVSN